MGTRVELKDIKAGTEIPYDVLVERLSYARDWLQNSSHSFVIQLTGNVPQGLGNRRLVLRQWFHSVRNWLVQAQGRSDQAVTIYDETTRTPLTIPAADGLSDPLEFDFKIAGRGPDGQMQNLDKPALLLEVCGALPYAPNLEGVQSARTLPLLTFMGLNMHLQSALFVMLLAVTLGSAHFR